MGFVLAFQDLDFEASHGFMLGPTFSTFTVGPNC
jgi:hypothetical protein